MKMEKKKTAQKNVRNMENDELKRKNVYYGNGFTHSVPSCQIGKHNNASNKE